MAAGIELPLQSSFSYCQRPTVIRRQESYMEHGPIVTLKLCHIYCMYAVEMLVSSA